MDKPIPMPGITAREFDSMDWVDPAQVLINLRWLESNLPSEMDDKVRRLRTNQLKEWREARIGALFAYGMSTKVLNVRTAVSKTESSDYDFVMRWVENERNYFYPVQLKELPPADLNPDISLNDIIDKLEKYSGETNLSVVIHINRQMRFEYRPWQRVGRPRINELWYLGCESADQSKWFLYGSVLRENPQKYDFEYPSGEQNVA